MSKQESAIVTICIKCVRPSHPSKIKHVLNKYRIKHKQNKHTTTLKVVKIKQKDSMSFDGMKQGNNKREIT